MGSGSRVDIPCNHWVNGTSLDEFRFHILELLECLYRVKVVYCI